MFENLFRVLVVIGCGGFIVGDYICKMFGSLDWR